ncbi:MAG: MFS transporter [Planctomycetes bacterium]|nr:MFS transporter [Planctomycetota bacterium]
MRLNQSPTWTRSHRAALVLAWFGWIFDFYDLILYTFLVTPISKELHFTDSQTAWLIGVSLGATGIGGAAFGILADRYGRKRILQWTVVTYSVGVFLSGFAQGFWSLLFFRVLTGVGVGGEWGVGHVLLSEIMPAQQRGRAGALMQSGAPLGVALATIVNQFVVPRLRWRGTFMLSGVPALLVAFMRPLMPESDVWLERRAAGKTADSYGAQIRELLSSRWRGRTFCAFVLTLFCMTAYWSTFSWMPKYLETNLNLHVEGSKIGPWMLCIVGGELLGYVAYGFVSDRLGRKPSFTIFAVISGIGLLMITVFAKSIEGSLALVITFMFVVGIGTGYWSNFGPYFSELFGTRLRATAVCTAFNLARGAQFYTPSLVASLAGRYGLAGGISIAALFSFAAAAWIWTLPETKGLEIDQTN